MTLETSLEPPLGTRWARVLLVAFALVHVLLAAGAGPTPPVVTVLALAVIVGAAAVLVLTPGRVLSERGTAAVLVLTAVGLAAVVPWLPATGWPGYAAWPLGAAMIIAIGLAVRGRIGAAWLQMAVMAAVSLLWSARGGAAPLAGIDLVDRHAGTLLLGTLFAVGLRRTARSHDELLAIQRAEILERGRAEAELTARREVVDRVLAEAGPILQRIAAGEEFDDEERARIAAVEGSLRDEITLGPILSEQLDQALESARQRGLDVLVLTEPSVQDLSTPVRLRAAQWIAGQLDRAGGAEFVGRVVTRGRDARVSATVGEHIEDRIITELDD